jgi:hypothetical protein
VPERRLSIGVVKQVGRQVVGSVTAACVLLCSIYCACGAAGAAATDDCHVSAAETPRSQHHCHGHPSSPVEASHSGSEGKAPEPGGKQDSGAGCGHCEPTLAKVEQKASTPGFFGTFSVDLAPCAIATLSDQTVSHLPPCSGDLPPPLLQPTLLSLHCALNT